VPSAGLDPVAEGAFLHVYNNNGSGDSACFALPAAGWVLGGSSAKPRYRYRDPASTNGPCRSASIRQGRLKLVCRASGGQPIPYSLNEPAQVSVGVDFGNGVARYCAGFGGTLVRDSGAEGVFIAKNAAASNCTTPPVTCP
jgi:hypothetical protein